jgi:hypothetical protein
VDLSALLCPENQLVLAGPVPLGIRRDQLVHPHPVSPENLRGLWLLVVLEGLVVLLLPVRLADLLVHQVLYYPAAQEDHWVPEALSGLVVQSDLPHPVVLERPEPQEFQHLLSVQVVP